MTTPNRPPLWREMAGAWSARVIVGRPDAERLAIAAEIRAVAHWIKKARPDYDEVLHGAIRADELDSILALLTTEADRAERGSDG